MVWGCGGERLRARSDGPQVCVWHDSAEERKVVDLQTKLRSVLSPPVSAAERVMQVCWREGSEDVGVRGERYFFVELTAHWGKSNIVMQFVSTAASKVRTMVWRRCMVGNSVWEFEWFEKV